MNIRFLSSGKSPRRKSSSWGRLEVSQGVPVLCLISFGVVAASLLSPGLLWDLVGKSVEPTKEAFTTHLLTPPNQLLASPAPGSPHPLQPPSCSLCCLPLIFSRRLSWPCLTCLVRRCSLSPKIQQSHHEQEGDLAANV